MFTGVVQERGRIAAVLERGGLTRLEIEADAVLGDLAVGGSLAVNGACLTATAVGPRTVTVEAVPETLRRTNLAALASGARVNLERPLAVGGRLEGHWVQGHVDAVARVRGRRPEAEGAERLEIELPAGLARYVVEKGSIAVDGVSLTVGEVGDGAFAVYLIPHTLSATTLGERHPGQLVNLEADILAKHLERLLAAGSRAAAPAAAAASGAIDALLAGDD